MSNIKIAKRYAKGLYLFADTEGKKEEVYNEIMELQKLIQESKDLRSFLASPILDYKTKQKIASSLFASYSLPIRNFINLMIQRGRESALYNVTKEYITYSDIQNHIKKAVLTSAVALDQSTIDDIIKKSQLIDAQDTLELENKIDPSIIGGYILRVGDQQLDASVKSRFTELRHEFDENYYIPKF